MHCSYGMHNFKYGINPKSEIVKTVKECMDFVDQVHGFNETTHAEWSGEVGNKANFPPGCFVLCSESGVDIDCFSKEQGQNIEIMFNSILDPSLTAPDTFPTNAAVVFKRCIE